MKSIFDDWLLERSMASALAKAMALPKVREGVGDKPPRRVIYVKGKTLNVIPG